MEIIYIYCGKVPNYNINNYDIIAISENKISYCKLPEEKTPEERIPIHVFHETYAFELPSTLLQNLHRSRIYYRDSFIR
jgi:hypothetical protein